jgi:hypothetical protein
VQLHLSNEKAGHKANPLLVRKLTSEIGQLLTLLRMRMGEKRGRFDISTALKAVLQGNLQAGFIRYFIRLTQLDHTWIYVTH